MDRHHEPQHLGLPRQRRPDRRLDGPCAGLLLHHVGRKSGEERVAPLLYLPDGEDMVIVASYGGAPKNPAWYHNLRAKPETVVEVGRERRPVTAHVATEQERERLWPAVLDLYPAYADYQARTERTIPLIVLKSRA